MEKYIDSEKLIAEINERLMSVDLEKLGNFGCHRAWAYNDVKDIIGSLRQERYRMKDYPYVPGWRQNKENNKPAIKHSILMLTTHGVAEGEWDGNEWIQYRWSCKLKDSDVLYWIHLEDLMQLEKERENIQQEKPIQLNTLTWKDINNLERIINNVHYEFRNGIGEKSFGEEVLERFREERDEKEQPEVDLEKEIDKEWKKSNPLDEGMGVESAYIHIEAFDMIARHFYELGLKARKEE